MKKSLLIIFLMTISFIAGAYAQSTATPILLGFLTTSGCSGSLTTCWQPYSTSNPMPVISN